MICNHHSSSVNGFPTGGPARIGSYNVAKLGSSPDEGSVNQVPTGESFSPTAAPDSGAQIGKVWISPNNSKPDAERLARQANEFASKLSGMGGSLSGISCAWLERNASGRLEQVASYTSGQVQPPKTSMDEDLLNHNFSSALPLEYFVSDSLLTSRIGTASDHFGIDANFSFPSSLEPCKNPDGFDSPTGGSWEGKPGNAGTDFQFQFGEQFLYS
jgi:hypothetical protein